jgi:CheY-like chemotaxis protein
LQNALLNLGLNARDAMPEGGVIMFSTANVELDSWYCESSAFNLTPGPFIEISISDTGMGMPKEVVERIFEPFFTTKGVGKGTGLGLAAVYNTLKENHGSISVYSEIGMGTVFKLYLPLSTWESTAGTVTVEVTHGSGCVLLVDDEPLIRNVGRELLQNNGYHVFLAEDGEQALEMYAQNKENISLVILDMIMPKMGGKETLEQLVKNYPEVRVLIASGFYQHGNIEELLNLGAKGFIQKPYNPRAKVSLETKNFGEDRVIVRHSRRMCERPNNDKYSYLRPVGLKRYPRRGVVQYHRESETRYFRPELVPVPW